MKVSSDVKGVSVGRILNVTTLLEVESFQSGGTQVCGTKLFRSLLCAMSKLWSHLQSNGFNGETIEDESTKFFLRLRSSFMEISAPASPGILVS